MAIRYQDFGDYCADNPNHFLWDWARRTRNEANIEKFFVEVRRSQPEGRIVFRIHDAADNDGTFNTDPQNPKPIDLSKDNWGSTLAMGVTADE
jgi:hypothetical protein